MKFYFGLWLLGTETAVIIESLNVLFASTAVLQRGEVPLGWFGGGWLKVWLRRLPVAFIRGREE